MLAYTLQTVTLLDDPPWGNRFYSLIKRVAIKSKQRHVKWSALYMYIPQRKSYNDWKMVWGSCLTFSNRHHIWSSSTWLTDFCPILHHYHCFNAHFSCSYGSRRTDLPVTNPSLVLKQANISPCWDMLFCRILNEWICL